MDGKDAKGVLLLRRDKFRVVSNVDGNKDCAAKDRDGEEDPAHHTKEADKCNGIKTELIEEDRLLDMKEGGDP